MLKSLPFCTESPKQHIFHSKVCYFKIHFPVCPVFQVGENIQLRYNPPQIFSEECVTCLVLPKCQFWTRKIKEFCLNTTESNWRLFSNPRKEKLCLQTQASPLLARKNPSPSSSDPMAIGLHVPSWVRPDNISDMLSKHAYPLTKTETKTMTPGSDQTRSHSMRNQCARFRPRGQCHRPKLSHFAVGLPACVACVMLHVPRLAL